MYQKDLLISLRKKKKERYNETTKERVYTDLKVDRITKKENKMLD
jgi:hypothetical protein